MIGAILNTGLALADKFIETPEEKNALKLKLREMADAQDSEALAAEVQIIAGQLAVNRAEAESGSLFRGGWRPFVGWICGVGLAYEFLVRTILPWLVQVAAWTAGRNLAGFPEMPPLDTGALLSLLGGLLGLGGLRTVERLQGKIPTGR